MLLTRLASKSNRWKNRVLLGRSSCPHIIGFGQASHAGTTDKNHNKCWVTTVDLALSYKVSSIPSFARKHMPNGRRYSHTHGTFLNYSKAAGERQPSTGNDRSRLQTLPKQSGRSSIQRHKTHFDEAQWAPQVDMYKQRFIFWGKWDFARGALVVRCRRIASLRNGWEAAAAVFGVCPCIEALQGGVVLHCFAPQVLSCSSWNCCSLISTSGWAVLGLSGWIEACW